MRIMRSKGTSYTRYEGRVAAGTGKRTDTSAGDQEPLRLPSRGLLLKNKAGNGKAGTDKSIFLWDSYSLPDQLEQDRDLLLRQYIQWLDKALKKPRSLKHFDIPSYVARTHLGTCLWRCFADLQFEDVSTEDAEYKRYLIRWQAKVHPYARHEVNWAKPETDGNADEIRQARATLGNTTGAAISKTRWTSVFEVPIGSLSVHAYQDAAGKIEDHLRVQELTIQGNERRSKKRSTGYGFINKRGEVITQNATDPRDIDGFQKHKVWSAEIEALYFQHDDIAQKVAASFAAEPRAGRPKQRIGAALYQHFEPLVKDSAIQGVEREQLWNLHNRIRQYYRAIGESTRFLEALRTNDQKKLRFLLPKDSEELLDRVRGKRDARYINRRIRLGKIIAHSVDLCSGYHGEDFDGLVHHAMDYYTTSIGQSDIKRNEAFVRVLRNAVAFSMRTHGTWLQDGLRKFVDSRSNDKSGKAIIAPSRDLSERDTAVGALQHQPLNLISSHAEFIFGAKKHQFKLGSPDSMQPKLGVSRTDLLFDGTDNDKEVVWGLLRLAAQVRNRSYHFNTKKRLLNTLEGGLVIATDRSNKLKPLAERDHGSLVDAHALAKLNSVLDYDVKLDAHILVQMLDALRFHKYVPPETRVSNLNSISRLPASDDRVTPKFMVVLKKGRDLASNDSADLIPASLKPFAQLQLNDLSKDQGSVNHDKIGILRLLYNRAFPNWLEQLENTPAASAKIFKEILASKRKRREVFLTQTGRVLADDELLADVLLDTTITLSELELAFMAESLSFEEREADDSLIEEVTASAQFKEAPVRPANPYVADRTRQSDESSALQKLRCEVYAYLFAEFIHKSEFDWVWSTKEPVYIDAPKVSLEEVARTEHEEPDWLKQFYAWLYLVPTEQVVLLQHQFRKTKVLEAKARHERLALFPEAGEVFRMRQERGSWEVTADMSAAQKLFSMIQSNDEKADSLRALDRVMGLYTRVQAAGFSGEEFSRARQFFADGKAFDELLAKSDEGEVLMLPGTVSGLQQLARLGTLDVLRKTFENHQVSPEEVRTLKDVLLDSALAPFSKKQELHSKLKVDWKQKPRDEAQLRRDVDAYRKLAAEVAGYNFDIAAARLSDFTNTHHLLMTILGRLADFTAIWERDRDCVLLALAYDRDPNLRFVNQRKEGVFISTTSAGVSLQIYWRQAGFAPLNGRTDFLSFAGCSEQPWMQRFFGLPKSGAHYRAEHSKDVALQLKVKADLKRQRTQNSNAKTKVELKPNVGHRFEVSTIRNDLAHFNVLDYTPDLKNSGRHIPRRGFNLSYVINAVRALMSYDRKFKNAVPKAIADIVQKQGMALAWKFNRDRLTDAILMPVFQPHLDFIRYEDGSRATFDLPIVSPRRLSMTRALFDFGNSGYLVDADGGKLMAYPEHVAKLCAERGCPTDWPKTRKLASGTRK